MLFVPLIREMFIKTFKGNILGDFRLSQLSIIDIFFFLICYTGCIWVYSLPLSLTLTMEIESSKMFPVLPTSTQYNNSRTDSTSEI